MRLQLDLTPVSLGSAARFTGTGAAAVAEQARALLTGAGFEVSVGEDRAEVVSDSLDWALLSPEERAAGGFDYPELVIAGPARAVVDVFLTSVFVSTAPDVDAEQAATAQAVRVLRALAPLVVVPDETRRDLEREAARQHVSADGTVLRAVLSRSELADRAVVLFDAVRSPEAVRDVPEQLAAQLATLGDHVTDLPPFRASVAAEPSGSSFGYELPDRPPFTSDGMEPLRRAMKPVIKAALAGADERSGLPTGLVVDHDGGRTTAALMFDNLVDSGAMSPTARARVRRSAPFAWASITARAARRDPDFQPSWLPEAVDLLTAGGTDLPTDGSAPSGTT